MIMLTHIRLPDVCCEPHVPYSVVQSFQIDFPLFWTVFSAVVIATAVISYLAWHLNLALAKAFLYLTPVILGVIAGAQAQDVARDDVLKVVLMWVLIGVPACLALHLYSSINVLTEKVRQLEQSS